MTNRKGCANNSPSVGCTAHKEGRMEYENTLELDDQEKELLNIIRNSKDPVRAFEIAITIICESLKNC